ncbi:uncharacterized protein LOC135833643 [Planococcus citri]|uniref:uncharacterized protein LOC135833643 n=1 Tax=Planococcus citri TaxID=170843 RepID=UPI0031F96527
MAPSKRTPASIRKLIDNIRTTCEVTLQWIVNPATVKSSRELRRRIQNLEQRYTEARQLNEELLIEDETETGEAAIELENLLLSTMAQAETLLDSMETKETVASEGSYLSCRGPKLNIRLPKIGLPEFSGQPPTDNWTSFFQRFSTALQDPSIPDIHRLEYLFSCLKGDAAKLVDNIKVLEGNYDVVLRILRKRYDNKRLNLRINLQQLSELKSVRENDAESLRKLVNTTTVSIRAVENMGFKRDQLANELITQLVVTKLDTRTRELWETSLSDSLTSTEEEDPDVDSYTELMDFLEKRIRVLASVFVAPENSNNAPNTGTKARQQAARTRSAATLVSNKPENADTVRTCPVCNKAHALYQCDAFKALSPTQHYEKVREEKLCVNCFSNSHWSKACKSVRCKTCGRSHHTLLHSANFQQASSGSATSGTGSGAPGTGSGASGSASATGTPHDTSTPPKPDPAATVVTGVAQRRLRNVLLGTAMLCASPSGKESNQTCTATALLDGGSHITLITSQVARQLNLNLRRSAIQIGGVGGSQTSATSSASIRIASNDGQFSRIIHASVVDYITDPLPSCSFAPPSTWQFISQYQLADPRFYQSKSVDILIGADYLYDIMLPEIIKQASAPTLLASRLGWVVSGPYSASAIDSGVRCTATTVQRAEFDAVSQFLGLSDELSAQPKKELSVQDEFAEQLFIKTHTRINGRFSVRLPILQGQLGESYKMAQQRLARCKVSDSYREFLREYEALGHMTRVNTLGQAKYYIPHHSVFHNGKIRVVFDASMRTTNGLSLNDILPAGPILQKPVYEVLTVFRTYRYAFMADIIKMFRQFLIDPEDRTWQHILWYDENGGVIECELNTITYGTRSAIYLAVRCVYQIAAENKQTHPAAAAAILKGSYIDDFTGGAESLTEAIALRDELIDALSSACLELGKWQANDPGLLPATTTAPESADKPAAQGRALGIDWNTEKDVFEFVSLTNLKWAGKTLTKRSALSFVASIFDPLGLLAPLTIAGKLLIQQLWSVNAGWDDPVSPQFQKDFDAFCKKLPIAATMKFERYLRTGDPKLPAESRFEIHGFGDASKQAYAACVYIRSWQEGTPSTCLIRSKTRVAPQNQSRTIPQLELCAADLLVQLVQEVATTLNYPLTSCYMYTDSMVVLAYLARDSSHWKPYVANRVKRISTAINFEQWRHISGDQNPADMATRDDSFSAFQQRSTLWTNGPDFLQNATSPPAPVVRAEFDLDSTPAAQVYVNVISASKAPLAEYPPVARYLISRYSEFSSARNKVAAWLRVKDYLLAKIRQTPLPQGQFSARELRRAELELVKAAQEEAYGKEIEKLKAQKTLPRRSPLSSLAPLLDNDLVRVGGRISRAELPYRRRHPLILPANHRLTQLLIRDAHFRFAHAGLQFINSYLRSSYWFVGNLTAPIQKAIRTCAKCARFRRNAQRIPPMADLPEDRVRPNAPFSVVGVDYAGPFTRKSEIRTRSATALKTYVAVFVCFSTRAVHLEMVLDLTTAAFLAALKRFAARRGSPSVIYSDNGTNFTGAASELTQKFAELSKSPQIQAHSWPHPIEWNFNPPSAPHMGGLWESAVRIMKNHLYRTMGSTVLTADEFGTVLCQIEAIMNSRPMTPIKSSSLEPDALTPGHFIIGRPLVAIPDDITENEKIRYSQRWDLTTQLRNTFWRRWSEEYLTSLQKRHKWTDPARSYQIDDIVLIQENTSPLTWPLARVIHLHPGSDDVVRVVDLRTRNGSTLRRPVAKLIPLLDTDEVSTP